MSNQIVISSGAKVRSLEGVLTGTAGIVSSVPLGAANGVATLDSSGKVPLSQLPASVVTYLGTWNAATNTPTLTNGVGDVGDLYICNVAGTVNFGAGPITFAVGDWVIYNGSQWQKSAGQNGTVTSVAVTESGDALNITGSPITTAGTINIGFAGNSTQYINGEGNLVTFPTLITEAQNLITDVYNETGATLTKGTVVYINGGHGNLPTVTKAIATGDATSAQTYGVVQADISNNNNGHVVVIGSLGDLDTQAYAAGTQLYLSSTTAGAWTSTKQYAPAHLVYVGIVVRSHPTQGVVEVKIQNGFELDELHNVSAQSPSNGDILQYISSTNLWTSVAGSTSNITEGSNLYFTNARARDAISLTTTGTSGAATYNSTTGVLNIPQYAPDLSDYVTLSTTQTISGAKTFSAGVTISNTGTQPLKIANYATSLTSTSGYTTIGTNAAGFQLLNGGGSGAQFFYAASPQAYYLPSTNGTLALTSQIPTSSTYVDLTSAQTIAGIKTFSNEAIFNNGVTLNGGYITYKSGIYNLTLNTNLLTANRNVFLQDKAGTIALTSDLTGGTVTSVGLSSATSGVTIGSSPITTSGTITLSIATASGSQQGLLSSTDWTTFNNKQNALTNPVTGTGTSSYHAKFTGTSTIGNSMLTDDGTTLQSIGATRSNLYLRAASSSYYGQLAFTNGSNGSFGGISYNNSGQYMQFETNSSEWMRLTSTGNLGIGTTSPSQILHLYGTSIRPQIESTANGGYSTLRFVGKNSGGTSRTFEVGLNVSADDVWQITNGTTAFVNVNTSGNVGIGTSSPINALDVRISSSTAYSSNSAGNVLTLYNTSTTTGAYAGIDFISEPTSGNAGRAAINLVVTGSGTGNLCFSTRNGTLEERMRITSDGKINHSTTSQSFGGIQTGNATSGGEASMGFISGVSSFGGTPTSVNGDQYVWAIGLGVYGIGGNYFGFASKSDTWRVKLAYNGTSWTGNSDIRLKNIEGYIENAITKVNSLSAIYYNFKSEQNPKRRVGLIAQELLEVLPEVVDIPENEFNEDGQPNYLGVQYVEVVPLLVAAIKELSAKVTALEN